MRYLFALLALAVVACQSAPKSARTPSSLPDISEQDRIFNGTVIEFGRDLEIQNKDGVPQMIQFNGNAVVADDEGGQVLCGISVQLKERTTAVIKAGRRFEVSWISSPVSGVPHLGLFNEGAADKGYSEQKGSLHCRYVDKDGQNPQWGYLFLGPMTLSQKYLESSFSVKVFKKAGAEEMRVEEIRYSPGDEKGPVLKNNMIDI